MSWSDLRNYPRIFLEELQDSQSPGFDMNPESSKYEQERYPLNSDAQRRNRNVKYKYRELPISRQFPGVTEHKIDLNGLKVW